MTPLTAPARSGTRARLARTPGAILGSSREKISESRIAALLDSMRSYGARYIIGIGGNGTMAELDQLSEFAEAGSIDLRIVGAPKTVDNDLPGVAFAPGYGSAARFVALAVRDFDCDFRAMRTFDDVTILETMGRDTGWLAAASVLLKESPSDAPHIVLMPERPVDEGQLLERVAQIHGELGRVIIVTNEMLKASDGSILGAAAQDGPTDALGRTMYSLSTGTGNYLAGLIRKKLGLQTRCLRPGSLGRALSCCVSEIDRELALRVGKAATPALEEDGDRVMMLTVARDLSIHTQPAKSGVGQAPVPEEFLDPVDRFGISPEFSQKVHKIIGPVEPIVSDVMGVVGQHRAADKLNSPIAIGQDAD